MNDELISRESVTREIVMKAAENEWDIEVVANIINIIQQTPSALVRCKDCKHNDGSCCDYSAVYTKPNGFCQWGERREDETD